MLAGGRGERLGGEKAGIMLAGRPLAAYPVAALRKAGIETLLCVKSGEPAPRLGVPVLHEPDLPRHPLCGIAAALRAAAGRPIVVLACDLPFVAPGLLAALASAPEPLVLPVLDGRPQPLIARYGPSLLAELEAALPRQESLTRTVERLRPRLLEENELARFGEPGRMFFNVNTDADLRHAEERLNRL